eukprot:gb/GECG01004782.1/.p1 GENE.gb/GECG01004782.1/~~gb/GECG01004782.1/.p1  ORF type:complete len:372 (+),score=12.72 gb/GECG01004782.1/:1-1116(+)
MAEFLVALRDFDTDAVDALCNDFDISGESTGLSDFSSLIQQRLRTRHSLRHIVRTEIINPNSGYGLPLLISTLYWLSSILTCKWAPCLCCCKSRQPKEGHADIFDDDGDDDQPPKEEWYRSTGSRPLIEIPWYASTDGFTPCKPCLSLPENYRLRQPGQQTFKFIEPPEGGLKDELLCRLGVNRTCAALYCLAMVFIPMFLLPVLGMVSPALFPLSCGLTFDLVFMTLLLLALIVAMLILEPMHKCCCSPNRHASDRGTQFACALYKKRLGKKYLVKRVTLVENASLCKCLWLQVRITFPGLSVHSALVNNPVWGFFEHFPTHTIAKRWRELADFTGGNIPRQETTKKTPLPTTTSGPAFVPANSSEVYSV